MQEYLVTREWKETVTYVQQATIVAQSEDEAIAKAEEMSQSEEESEFDNDEPAMIDATDESDYEYEAEVNA